MRNTVPLSLTSFIPLFTIIIFFIFFFPQTLALNPKCETQDHGSTLQVFHIFSPCSPFKPPKPLSWEQSVLQQQAEDQARVQYLSSLVARRSVVPIASGRQIMQSPTYIVRAKIGSPPQTLLVAMDTSNDAAWIPCAGCVGCSSSTFFDPAKSTSFKNLPCSDSQCKQVMNFSHTPCVHSVSFWVSLLDFEVSISFLRESEYANLHFKVTYNLSEKTVF